MSNTLNENQNAMFTEVATWIAAVKFSKDAAPEYVPVKLLDVDETGMAYVQYPSGLTGTQWLAELKQVTG